MSVVADAPAGEGTPAGGAPGSDNPGNPIRSRNRERMLEFTERYALVVLFIATLLFFSFWSKTSSTFPHAQNIKNVLGNEAVTGILALAIMIPLVCGEFDFSVGNTAGLTQVLCAGFMARLGMPVVLAVLVPIGIGAFIGVANGNTVARVGVNSLIVTLGISSVLLGIVEWYTGGQSIINHISQSLINLGAGQWLGLPKTIFYLAVVALLVHYMLEHTPFGRYLYSIGSNRDAAASSVFPSRDTCSWPSPCPGRSPGWPASCWWPTTGPGAPRSGPFSTPSKPWPPPIWAPPPSSRAASTCSGP